jgi:hypothetical protein
VSNNAEQKSYNKNMKWLKMKKSIIPFIAGMVSMLILVVVSSYVAMEREEWVSPKLEGSMRDVEEIKRVVARKYFLTSILTFPRRVILGRTGLIAGGISNIKVVGDWATIEAGPVDRYTCYFYAAGPGLRIYRKINGVWQTAKDRSEYENWIKEAPESLVSPEVKKLL